MVLHVSGYWSALRGRIRIRFKTEDRSIYTVTHSKKIYMSKNLYMMSKNLYMMSKL
jgi:hypothetical protein